MMFFQAPTTKKPRLPSGPRGLPLLGSGIAFKRDPLSFLESVRQAHGDVAKVRLGPQTMYLVSDPAYVKRILKDGASNYGKGNVMYEAMATLFGEATAIVDGKRWRQGFQLVQPSFRKEACDAAIPVMQRGADWLAKALGESAGPRDVAPQVSRMTLDIIVRQMFGGELGGEEEALGEQFQWLTDFIAHRVLSTIKWPLSWPLPRHRKYRSTLRALDSVIYRLVREGLERPSGVVSGSMLGDWITALKNGAVPEFGPRQLRDEVIGIFVAAHGSTAVYLSWILHHLGAHPEIQERAREEVRRIVGDRAPTAQDLPRLIYLSQVIHESMRLTPAGWIFSRTAETADRLGPFQLPAGAMVLISPYLVHRHPGHWDRPDEFDPERFSPERAEQIREATNECRYLPFAAGKRACIGRAMALTEALVVFTRLLQRLRWRVPPGREATPKGRFTLNLGGGLVVETEALGGEPR